jgi:hypothetical protein
VTVDGKPATVKLVVEDEKRLVLSGDKFQLSLSGTCINDEACRIEKRSGGRETIVFNRNGAAFVSGFGFKPGTLVHVWMFSDPKYLGALTVGSDGKFAGSLDLGNVALGEHTLQANGTSFDGAERSANIGVSVSHGAQVLPKTGSSGLALLLTALLALLGGLALQAVSRKSSTR